MLVPTGGRVLDLNGLVTLNAAGRCVWELLDGHHSVENLADALAGQFAVSREQARADVEEFLSKIEPLGLAVRDEASNRI
ncbi:MAG: PqqD family protein [Bryobacterales bacterium]|nr:PqqD family protein [Bryobacterales bacterium]